jgi:hypothetical protein
MKLAGLISAAALAALSVTGTVTTASAEIELDANCTASKGVDDISYREAHDVYLCLERQMFENYNKGDKKWVNANHVGSYRTWSAASTLPANPGPHSERFLFTYVNDIGKDAYTQFAEGVTMPVGTVLAKESFTINSKGKSKAGPLFFMEKVAAGTSPKTGDWFYTMVGANGKPQGVNVFKACHECHSGFEDSDFVAYPEPEVQRK